MIGRLAFVTARDRLVPVRLIGVPFAIDVANAMPGSPFSITVKGVQTLRVPLIEPEVLHPQHVDAVRCK